jgi:hypothetical protein
MDYNKVFCYVSRNEETGKKQVQFTNKKNGNWGDMKEEDANAEAILTGDNLVVIDIDTKKLKKIDKKLVSLLGEPTVETSNGYHYYFTGDVADIKQTQGLFDKVDVRNKGGLVFSKYWGDDDSISYTWIGDPKEMGKKLRKYLIKASKEKKKKMQDLVGNMVDVDGTWDRAKDGEHHNTTLALMIRDFKNGDTYDEVWTKSMIYIDNYLGGNHDHEDPLFKKRIDDTYNMFGNDRFGFKQREPLVVREPEIKKDKHRVSEKFEIKMEDWMTEPPIDTDAVVAYLHNTGYDHKRGKFRWVSSSGNSREFLRKDVAIFFKHIKAQPTDEGDLHIDEWLEEHSTKTNKKHSEYWNHIWNLMTGWIMFHHQYETLRVKIDPFGINSVRFNDSTMVVVTTDLIPRPVALVEDPKIVADYMEHFPQLHDVLDVMLAARFGADRKKAYMWMKAQSDWGKSFLFSGVLAHMGITTFMKEKELKLAMSGSPSGLNADDFSKSWLTVFEEFKGAVSELKDITHTLTLAPKGAARVEVDLYSKIFLSAENVNSLIGDGGAEVQFANRFMMMELSGSLVKRPVYCDDQQKYLDVIRSYVYQYFLEGIKVYIEMGREKASIHANEVLTKFRSGHELKAVDLMETVAEKRDVYFQKVTHSLSKFGECDSKKREYLLEIFAFKNKKLYILNLERAKEHFMKSEFGASDLSKLNHKTSKALLNLEDAKRVHLILNGIKQNAYEVLI